MRSRFGDTPVPVAGPGAPLVAGGGVAEFAAAVGLSTETGKASLGEALELRHRLRKDLGAGRGRGSAGVAGPPGRPRHGLALAFEGGEGSDQRPGRGFAHGCQPRGGRAGGGGDRPVHAGRGPASPEAADDGRHVHVHTHQVSFEGTVWVDAEVDLADALDLDTALSVGAARLADLGSANS